MATITVELEDNLSPAQISKIKDLLSMIRGVARISGGDSQQLGSIVPSDPGGFSAHTQAPGQQVNLDSLNPRQKKYIISKAMAWGSKNGKITLNRLERLSPEEIMNLATSFLSDMSDREKDEIFREIS
ncbi:MAG: hypothetical protein MJE63_32350 [Proteobacteria bacterium]|nr:hypothetical protein [Pseudomonadota bacterium]